MVDASSSGNEGTLAAYLEKTDRLNDLVLKLLQKISGTESSQPEDERGEHITDNGRRRTPNSPRHETGSDGSNPGEFVTKEELMGLLNDKRSIKAVDGPVFQPPYLREIQSKLYPKGYHPQLSACTTDGRGMHANILSNASTTLGYSVMTWNCECENSRSLWGTEPILGTPISHQEASTRGRI